MSAEILDGKALGLQLRKSLARRTEDVAQTIGRSPSLVVVIVGTDPASEVYVKHKQDACDKAGIFSKIIRLKETTTQENLVSTIRSLNNDDAVDGILVQLPLPKGLDELEVIQEISPSKDVDGLHPQTLGNMLTCSDSVIPCTTEGIVELLNFYRIDLKGKNVVIMGRSNIVGKPTALAMLCRDATITIVHGKTKDTERHLKNADVIVVAIGKPQYLKSDMIKKGAIIIDVGINRLESKIVGDCDFDDLKAKAGHITPVPGGVGPMTIAMLLKNTLAVAHQRHSLKERKNRYERVA